MQNLLERSECLHHSSLVNGRPFLPPPLSGTRAAQCQSGAPLALGRHGGPLPVDSGSRRPIPMKIDVRPERQKMPHLSRHAYGLLHSLLPSVIALEIVMDGE